VTGGQPDERYVWVAPVGERARAAEQPHRGGHPVAAATGRRARPRPAGRADHPGQRPRPHQAEHLRSGRSIQFGRCHHRGARREPGVRRGDRQAVHLLRRRGPDRPAAAHRPGPGAPDRPARPPGLRPAARQRRTDVRLRQRRRHGRRPGAGAALPLPDAVRRRGGAGAARGIAGPGTGLGRHPTAAQPDRDPDGGAGGHPEPADPEQDAQAEAGRRVGHRRRALRAGRLPGAVAGVGRRGGPGRGHRDPARGRPGDVGRRALLRPAAARRAAARRGAGRLPGAGPARPGQGRRPPRAARPASCRRAWPPRSRRWQT